MTFINLILTQKKQKNNSFILIKILNKGLNFAISMVLTKKGCKNYTIDNFTFM
jgi:hypothetical protein